MSDDESEYEVEDIIGEKTDRRGKKFYKVKWLGYAINEASWVASEDMHCPEILEKWNSGRSQKTSSIQSRKRSRSSLTTSKRSAPKEKRSRNSPSTTKSTSRHVKEGLTPKKETSSRSVSNTPLQPASERSRVKTKKSQSSEISNEKRSTNGLLSKKAVSDATTQNADIDDDEDNLSQLEEKYAYQKSKHASERAKRLALEDKLRKLNDRYDKVKREIAMIKFNQQLAGIRSSAGVAPSSDSDNEVSDEESESSTSIN